ncbi:ovoinhibitor-like [Liolophura sinensis]|uniref:ovoinhibitor-like n=1 Tax=Liolophura sinensis TaxID=3198878 RepID=UPI003158C082
MQGKMFFEVVLLIAVAARSGESAAVKPCDFVCPLSLLPVCGSDGETYDSKCDLRMANCRRKGLTEVTVVNEGPCGKNCTQKMPFRTIRPSRVSSCVPCPLNPVCGTDGQTYDSECDLKRSACLRKSLVKPTKAYDGPCQSAKPCEFVCPLSLSPVCGTDGQTYDSECDLKKSACLRRSLVKPTKAYDGPCQSEKPCEFVCPLSLSPVCGSDGQTYDSECDLRKSSCLRKSLEKVNSGSRRSMRPKKAVPLGKKKPCKFACPLSLIPVCGTDGRTYPSECDLRKAACK